VHSRKPDLQRLGDGGGVALPAERDDVDVH
jgi:hypothetical protein